MNFWKKCESTLTIYTGLLTRFIIPYLIYKNMQDTEWRRFLLALIIGAMAELLAWGLFSWIKKQNRKENNGRYTVKR